MLRAPIPPGGDTIAPDDRPPPADDSDPRDDTDTVEPFILPRPEHNVSRQDIDPDALKILYRLNQNGHKGYLVGGGVRDLMLGIRPKDFDIATDAKPRRLRRLFRNCRIIGRRFRLAHIHFPGDKIIEVATFRSSGESDEVVREGDMIQRDNVFGNPYEDAHRRDLTINGLFYDIDTFAIIDYVGGVADLRARQIRTVVDPVASFREDPVRMLRAIRHATRLDFKIEPVTRRALGTERDEILKANEARLLEEFYKDLASGRSRAFFEELHRSHFLELLIEPLVETFRQRGERRGKTLLLDTLERLDALREMGREITHALGIAALLSPLIVPVARELEDGNDDHARPEPFQEALRPAFSRLRVYRRDEDRLWHILGAWGRIDRAFRRETIPKSLSRRHYFPEAVEVWALLSPETPERTEFLEHVRSLPPPTEEEPVPRRRPRRRRRRSDGPERGGERSRDRKSDEKTGKKAGKKSGRKPDRKPDEKPRTGGSDAGKGGESRDSGGGGRRPRRRRRRNRGGARSGS